LTPKATNGIFGGAQAYLSARKTRRSLTGRTQSDTYLV